MDLLFAEKYIIFVLAKRREPIDKGFSPLFLRKKCPKNHCFTKHVEKFICRSEISTGFCGFFSGQVGGRIGDIGTRKVKIHLFSGLHFLHFWVTNLVVVRQCTAPCLQGVAQQYWAYGRGEKCTAPC